MNPFCRVTQAKVNEISRKEYVPADYALRAMECAPSAHWQLLIALARFAGLRCPSEHFSLKWSDVNFATGRMTVHSPKTEHLPGKKCRVVPLFPELRPYLEAAWDATPEGSDDYIFPLEWRQRAQRKGGWVNANFRTTFEKIIKRAGLQPWTRLFHSLRASCETDLGSGQK